MFDIGTMELFLVAVVALVVVGPRELPALLRSVTGVIGKLRGLAREFRQGLDTLADEVKAEADPFAELRHQEGLKPGMTPEEITEKILSNRGQNNANEDGDYDDDDTENTIHNNSAGIETHKKDGVEKDREND